MKSNVENIFAEMRKARLEALVEEKKEENINEAADIPEDGIAPAPEAPAPEAPVETPAEPAATEAPAEEHILKAEAVEEPEASAEEAPSEEANEECGDKDKDEELSMKSKATNGKAFTVEINGKKYSYFPTEESGLTAKELGEKYKKIAQHSLGRALSWLKKNAITTDTYRKPKNEEQEVNEEMTIVIDAEDILKAAEQIQKAKADGKSVKVTQSASGFKVEDFEDDTIEKDEPAEEPKEEPEEEKNEACSKEEPKDEEDTEVCPVCGKKHKKGEKCCEDTNEEVDVAELAVRLDECECSSYMKKALEDGKYDMVKKYLFIKEA